MKTAIITGATSGIGKESAVKLAKLGHQIILLSRNKKKLEITKSEIFSKTNNSNITTVKCDLSSQKDIKTVAKDVKKQFPVIDVVINNAGINTAENELTKDGIELTFAVNHLAYFLLTGLLLENIKRSKRGRIINVSSNGHRGINLNIKKIRNNEYKGRYSTYRRSKLANVMFTIDLANKLKESKVTVNCLHPGLINTNIGMNDPGITRRLVNAYKKRFAKTPEQGADTIIYLATSDKIANNTGKYFVNRKVTKYSTKASNKIIREKLWKLSEQLTNFTYTI